jgi:hypothetical protein
MDTRRELEMLRGRDLEVTRDGGMDVAWLVETVTGDVVKSADFVGGWLIGTRGNESTEDVGSET